MSHIPKLLPRAPLPCRQRALARQKDAAEVELVHLKKTLPRSPLARGQSGMSSQREQQLTRDLRDAEEEIASLRRKLQQQVGVFCVVLERASRKACAVPPSKAKPL